jgi:hypothetical protein
MRMEHAALLRQPLTDQRRLLSGQIPRAIGYKLAVEFQVPRNRDANYRVTNCNASLRALPADVAVCRGRHPGFHVF